MKEHSSAPSDSENLAVSRKRQSLAAREGALGSRTVAELIRVRQQYEINQGACEGKRSLQP